MLLSILLLIWTGCSDYAVDDAVNAIINSRVNLALNVSTSRASTRMSEDVTQVNYATHEAREIQDLKLFPFNIEGEIGDNKMSLPGMQYEVNELKRNNNYRFYFDDRTAKIPNGTASFLCYAQAKPMEDLSESVTRKTEFVNGKLKVTPSEWQSLTMTKTDLVTFTPEQIYTETETVGDKVQPKVTTKATGIAAYLTQIANAIPEDEREFFLKFINEGRLVACSSTNVQKLKEWVESWAASEQLSITLPAIPDDIADYPADILLPDGAAAVKWNNTEGKFEPQPVTTTEANINRLDRFIYPAELWYYANSRIYTSKERRRDDYIYSSYDDWATILDKYETANGVMAPSVHSVAIKDPLAYAVGCLQVGLVVSKTLKDADGTDISFATGDFPLKAVFVSGQYKQKFNFTPEDNVNEQIIYDPEIKDITMGDSKSELPNTADPEKYASTLVFQTKDNVPVHFALEFLNNSGQDFQGADGRIFDGTKFYLIGTIEVTGGQAEDYKNRAFTKNYITQGTVRISSLKQAYPYLPDLLDPRLEIAIKLVPKWIQSTTTNVPL